MGGFWFLAIVFHYNVFNTMVSFCGSFFLVRGVVIILFNSQLAELKQFLHSNGFEPILWDNWNFFENKDSKHQIVTGGALIQAAVMILLFCIVTCIKHKMVLK